jgi:large subunit ribosomal protein L4
MEAKIYNQKGKEAGTIALPEAVFGLPWNADLVHQVVTGMLSNARHGTADTKGRGEVVGGGKKPWRQKGTGRARHGSIRSPLWKGGGVTHGPLSEKDYSKKINKKMRAKALYVVLSKKYKDGEVLFVDSLAMPEAKTKIANAVLSEISKIDGFAKITKKKNATLVATSTKDTSVARSLNNLTYVELGMVKDLNPVEVLKHKYLIITEPKESIDTLAKRLA